MIVLTTEQKNDFMQKLRPFEQDALRTGLQIIPIEMRTGWILPEAILSDRRLETAVRELQRDIDSYTKRPIDKAADNLAIPPELSK